MSTRTSRVAPTIDLVEAGRRIGYASETLRQMMWRDPNPPPFYKVRGRWRADLDEFDAWAIAQGIRPLPFPDES